jgi:stage II sporulation protein D
MKRWAVLMVWLVACLGAAADPILVGLHCQSNYLRCGISPVSGSYQVFGDGKLLFSISPGHTSDITAIGGKVNIFFSGKNHTGFKKITWKTEAESEFKTQPAGQKPLNRIYKGELIACCISGHLQLVNRIDIEDYVAGVIEAESGTGNELEYYKVQAVISRTYALNNRTRHFDYGFEVCDGTHCQVYHGKPRKEPLAVVAAEDTEDIVIVDHEINLITAAFHSNCGGHTVNAEVAWSKPVPYLIGRPDTFCLSMPHSRWEKSIPIEKWNSYLKQKRSSNDLASLSDGGILGECNPLYCHDSTLFIPRRAMRTDLKLRSTQFDLTMKPTEVIFMGKGFGHGVGLCQEGAMRMASLGFSYKDIIHYYYTDVHLIQRRMLWFFRE